MRELFILSGRFLLLPLSLIYGLLMEIRNRLYDFGLFKVYRAPFPVISVGNIEAGGTGKTPFTIFIAGLMLRQNRRVAIVLRGYGRKSRGYHLIADGRDIRCDVFTAGDEAYLLACRLPGAIVMVSERRIIALKALVRDFQPDLVILDDAFQHRSVHRDLDLVLFKQIPSGFARCPLPVGRLREFWFNIQRADWILAHQLQSSAFPIEKILRQTDGIFDSLTLLPVEERSINYCAFTAIARPGAFFGELNQLMRSIGCTIDFPDHHWFGPADLDKIRRMASKAGCQALICTEKDAVKLEMFRDHPLLTEFPLHVLRISDSLAEDSVLVEKIQRLVDKFGG